MLSFICMFCRSLFVLLYFFFLAIVLSALLRYTDSDYPFGECTSPWTGLELTTACLRKKLPFYAVKATLNYMYNIENNIVLYSSRYTYICSKKCCILGPSWSWSYCSWIYNYLCNQWITTKIVTSNPDHGEVYSIQYYLMKFGSDLRQVGGFLGVLQFPPLIKLTATI